jgi:nucleotide-binding universal stress UspA family protein
MFRSLLVPLDGSVFSEHALPFALGIANRAGAPVQLLQVHVPLDDFSVILALDSGPDERIKEQESAYLDRIVRLWRFAAPEAQMSSSVLEGFAPDVLRERPDRDDHTRPWAGVALLAGQRRRRSGTNHLRAAAATVAERATAPCRHRPPSVTR